MNKYYCLDYTIHTGVEFSHGFLIAASYDELMDIYDLLTSDYTLCRFEATLYVHDRAIERLHYVGKEGLKYELFL